MLNKLIHLGWWKENEVGDSCRIIGILGYILTADDTVAGDGVFTFTQIKINKFIHCAKHANIVRIQI